MKTLTAKTFLAMPKENTCYMGTVPCIIYQNIITPIRVTPECGQVLITERYGGGTRYHCPACDRSRNYYGRAIITYTNAPTPTDKTCHRPGRY